LPPELIAPERVSILGLPLDLVDLETTVNTLKTWVQDPSSKRTVITLNPEIVVQSEQVKTLETTIRNADLITADGVGIVWAAKRFGHQVPGRATGVDIIRELMQTQGSSLRVFFLGAAPGVAQRAAEASHKQFGIQIAGVHDGKWGYEWNPDDVSTAKVAEEIARVIRESQADLLLTALGSTPTYPTKQEIFNERFRPARVSIGIGGALNVLSGEVELAPDWTRKLGIEWVWRITTMGRWARAWRLVEFVGRVLTAKK
jgi:N-acetylglucosaminyldiphosphoundecaprenol N-acetyl-beta-D-mannosaminyltransferase